MALARRRYDPALAQRTGEPEQLRQQVIRELRRLVGFIYEVADEVLEAASGSSGGAPVNASYVVVANNGTLTADRALAAGTGITLTDAGANSTLTVATTITQYTDELVRDTIGATLVAGTGIGIVVNDAGDTITVSSSITQYTDENARDAIGAALVGGTGITVTPNDGADTITVATTITQYTDEMARDALGAALTAGTGITITPNDGADTITIATNVTVGDVADRVIYLVDYTAQANNTLVTGAETIDSHTYAAANEGNATTFEILNGTGLHFDASIVNTAFSSSSQTAPRLEISMTNLLGTDFNPSRRYRFDCRLGALTMAVNNNFFAFGISPSGSGFSNMGFAQKIRLGGLTSARHFGPGSSTTSVQTAAYDVFSLLVYDGEIASYAAVWGGSYPELRSMDRLGASGISIVNATENSFLQLNARLFFAFATGEVGGTMDVVVRELRAVEVH